MHACDARTPGELWHLKSSWLGCLLAACGGWRCSTWPMQTDMSTMSHKQYAAQHQLHRCDFPPFPCARPCITAAAQVSNHTHSGWLTHARTTAGSHQLLNTMAGPEVITTWQHSLQDGSAPCWSGRPQQLGYLAMYIQPCIQQRCAGLVVPHKACAVQPACHLDRLEENIWAGPPCCSVPTAEGFCWHLHHQSADTHNRHCTAMLQLLRLLLGVTLGLCDLEWAQPTGYLAASHRKSVRGYTHRCQKGRTCMSSDSQPIYIEWATSPLRLCHDRCYVYVVCAYDNNYTGYLCRTQRIQPAVQWTHLPTTAKRGNGSQTAHPVAPPTDQRMQLLLSLVPAGHVGPLLAALFSHHACQGLLLLQQSSNRHLPRVAHARTALGTLPVLPCGLLGGQAAASRCKPFGAGCIEQCPGPALSILQSTQHAKPPTRLCLRLAAHTLVRCGTAAAATDAHHTPGISGTLRCMMVTLVMHCPQPAFCCGPVAAARQPGCCSQYGCRV
jgi:hypothetical protein